jgi:uncharacterized protein (DUF433 family)
VGQEAKSSLYGQEHPADAMAYSLSDVWRYLRVSPALVLMSVPPFRPIWLAAIAPPDLIVLPTASDACTLPFRQLTQIHVLTVLGRWVATTEDSPSYGRRLAEVVDEAGVGLQTPPSATAWKGEAGDRFVAAYLRRFRVNESFRPKLRELLDLHLDRIEWEDEQTPRRVFPFTRDDPRESPRLVAIDPRVRFGKPSLLRRGLPTDVVRERFQAGESISLLADDFDLTVEEVEEVLRYEGPHD